MAVDHSETYRSLNPKNLIHRWRAADILRVVSTVNPDPNSSYADIGCSNGYITELVAKKCNFKCVAGYDHSEDHFNVGRKKNRNIIFHLVDINKKNAISERYDFSTCFETLEHTGNIDNASENFINSIKNGGTGIITVPIEIGKKGIFKFIIKSFIYRYSLDELPDSGGGFWVYLQALLKGERISTFRDEREGWGTHFGFDYRDLDEILARYNVYIKAFNRGFSRFYIVRKPKN